MSSNLIEELWTVEMQYIETRAEAEKSKDPKKVKKIRIAAKNLEKARLLMCGVLFTYHMTSQFRQFHGLQCELRANEEKEEKVIQTT